MLWPARPGVASAWKLGWPKSQKLANVLLFDLSSVFSRIRLLGSGRLGFLHRISTGDLRGLKAGEGRPTVLTTPIGRMVDYLIVLAFESSTLLIGGGGNQEKVVRWLRKYIFFNDDVQVHDESALGRLWGMDDQAAQALRAPALDLPEYAHQTVSSLNTGGGQLTFLRAPRALGLDWFVLVQGDVDLPISARPRPDFDAWRVERGYPLFPYEINEDYIPLETGLWSAVSFAKGCYTGQEVLARMESRGQIARRLVRLTANTPIAAGATLYDEGGQRVGQITSATPSAALAYVRSAFAQVGRALYANPDCTLHIAEVVRI
jgi:folate-binding protein YgfZ